MSTHNSPPRTGEQWSTTPSFDRRARLERRDADLGPPGGVPERREGHERRGMSVSEVRLSDAEWEQYFAQAPQR